MTSLRVRFRLSTLLPSWATPWFLMLKRRVTASINSVSSEGPWAYPETVICGQTIWTICTEKCVLGGRLSGCFWDKILVCKACLLPCKSWGVGEVSSYQGRFWAGRSEPSYSATLLENSYSFATMGNKKIQQNNKKVVASKYILTLGEDSGQGLM